MTATRNCEHCGTGYEPYRSTDKYCTPVCRRRAKQRRAYAKRPEAFSARAAKHYASKADIYQKQRHAQRREGGKEFIYVCATPNIPGFVKVGRTSTPQHRLGTYNIGCPFRSYRYAALFPVEDANGAECAAHTALDGHRVGNTEWFQIGADDAIALIQNLPIVKGYQHDNDN